MFERFETSNRQEREEMSAQLRELYRITLDAELETRSGGLKRLHAVAKARLDAIQLVLDVLGIDYSQF